MPRAVVALVVWTVLIWATRIVNIVRDEDLDGKPARIALAVGFMVVAGAVLVVAVRRGNLTKVVTFLAGWTLFVWILRGAATLVGDWSVGFKLVHTVLAAVSIALALWAGRSVAPPESVRASSAGSG